MNLRRSYKGLMALPAWLLLDADLQVVASVRAENADEARQIFTRHKLAGQWLRKGEKS